MQEANAAGNWARTGDLVQQFHALRLKCLRSGVDIVHLEADVVHPLAAPLDEARHRTGLIQGFEELNVAVADLQESGLDALFLDCGHLHDWQAKRVAISLERLIDALDGDADVVDAFEHDGSLY